MALREVIALLDVKVRGAEKIAAVNKGLDTFVTKTRTLMGGGVARGGGSGTLLGIGPGQLGGISAGPAAAVDDAATAMRRGAPAAQSFAGSIDQAKAAMGAFAAVMIVQRIASEVGALVEEVVSLGNELNATSKAQNMSVSELQQWRFIAGRANVDGGALVATMRRLTMQATSSPQEFRALGVSVRDASGNYKSANQLFRETGLALARIADPTERAAKAQKLFGKQASALLPIFADGEAGLDELIKRFHELGGGLSDDVVKGAAGADDAMGDFRLAMLGLKGVLVAQILPILTQVVTVVATGIGKFVQMTRTSSLMQTVLGGLALALGLVAIGLFPIWAPIVAIGAALAIVVLVVEDIVTAFRGGESMFGTFVETMLRAIGVNTTFAGALEMVGVAWLNLKAQTLDTVAAILEALDAMQQATGLELFHNLGQAAANLRGNAIGARADAMGATVDAARNEQGRLFERATAAKGRLVSSGEGLVGTQPTKRRGRVTHQHARVTAPITVNGAADPQRVADEVSSHVQRVLREAFDTMPEAEDEGEGDDG